MKFGVVLAAFVYTKGVLGSSNYTVCGNQICDRNVILIVSLYEDYV